MKKFIEISIVSVLFIALATLYFELVVNRPMNAILQTIIMIVMIVLAISYLVYLIKQLLKILNA